MDSSARDGSGIKSRLACLGALHFSAPLLATSRLVHRRHPGQGSHATRFEALGACARPSLRPEFRI